MITQTPGKFKRLHRIRIRILFKMIKVKSHDHHPAFAVRAVNIKQKNKFKQHKPHQSQTAKVRFSFVLTYYILLKLYNSSAIFFTLPNVFAVAAVIFFCPFVSSTIAFASE